jgi:hypothetical protein
MITVKATVSGANNIKKLQNVDTSSTTFSELVKRLAQKCNLGKGKISMSYRDEDGDQVDLDDEDTLQDAFQTTLAAQTSVKTLAILVQVEEAEEEPVGHTALSIDGPNTPLSASAPNGGRQQYGATFDDSFDSKEFGTPSKRKPRPIRTETLRLRGMLVVVSFCSAS